MLQYSIFEKERENAGESSPPEIAQLEPEKARAAALAGALRAATSSWLEGRTEQERKFNR